MHNPVGRNGLNVIMSDGNISNLPLKGVSGGNNWQEVRIKPVGAVVKKVVTIFDADTEWRGFQFFD